MESSAKNMEGKTKPKQNKQNTTDKEMLPENLYLYKKLFFIQPIHHLHDIINSYHISMSHSGFGVFI